jgi:hypothetical protein
VRACIFTSPIRMGYPLRGRLEPGGGIEPTRHSGWAHGARYLYLDGAEGRRRSACVALSVHAIGVRQRGREPIRHALLSICVACWNYALGALATPTNRYVVHRRLGAWLIAPCDHPSCSVGRLGERGRSLSGLSLRGVFSSVLTGDMQSVFFGFAMHRGTL